MMIMITEPARTSTETNSQVPRGQRAIALVLAAVAGAAVMVVELGVARILTPVFGGSITVWALVIATTMLALAAGYMFGGRRADLKGGIYVAQRAAIYGALLCASIPLVRRPLIEVTIDLSTVAGAAISAVVLIAPSLFFLSQVSPALIRGLSSGGAGHIGGTAGGVYAISTMGSLVGTLAAVWMLLYTPLSVTFIGTAFITATTAIVLKPHLGTASLLVVMLSVAMIFSLGTNGQKLSALNARGEICTLVEKRHSLYGEIKVLERNGDYRYMVANGFDQGGIYIPTGLSTYNYDDALIAVVDLYLEQPESALIIGLGPGVMAKTLAQARVSVDVVEIDSEVLSAAREYFGYTGDAEIDDGRRFLQRSDHRWDVIFVDAFLGGSPPWQLYTREAFESYRSHLEHGGVVVLNLVGNHLDPDQLPALASVAATARTVFPTVDIYPDPWESDDYPTRNIFLAVSNRPRLKPLKPGSPTQADTLVDALARSRPIKIAPGRVLTDDSAPLEPLVRRTTEILRSRAREYLPLSLLIE